MRYFRAVFILIVLAVLAAGVAIHLGWIINPLARGPSPVDLKQAKDANGKSERPKDLSVMGWLEPADGILNINGLPGDRLDTLAVSEDSVVEKGQTLAVLGSRPVKQLQVDSLDCQLNEAMARKKAEAELADVRILTAKLGIEKVKLRELEAESQEKKIDLLKANRDLAKKDYDRMTKLRTASVSSAQTDAIVSEQELERQQLVLNRAETELAAAQADLKMLRTTQRLSLQAADAEHLTAIASKQQTISAVPIESLKKHREIAQAEADLATIAAPCKGTVLKVFIAPGESVGQKPLLRMANLDRMVAIAEVYEGDAKRVSKGQIAVIRSEAFHAPLDKTGLKGRVVRIGNTVNTPELRSLDPYARVDRHVIPIRIELDAEGSAEAAHFVNLQVEVKLVEEGS